MGIYNPNAIMPKNCAVCHEECKYRNITAHKRHKRCPLVEVKVPHGRLVDAKKFHRRLQKQAMTLYESDHRTYQLVMDIMEAVHTEPTVIEAEEGE